MRARLHLPSLLSIVLISACTTAPVSYAPPGALNLQVTQVTIDQTICIAGSSARRPAPCEPRGREFASLRPRQCS